MFLDINTIGREKVSFDRLLSLPELQGGAGDTVRVVEARIEGEAGRAGRGVELTARLTARLRLSCSRCLEPFDFAVDGEFRRLLIAESTAEDGEERRITDDDEETLRVPGGHAQLEEIVTEQLYLSLPLKPICSSTCAGLCPQCGANRNVGTCGCRPEEVAPRLAPLLEFKRRRGES